MVLKTRYLNFIFIATDDGRKELKKYEKYIELF